VKRFRRTLATWTALTGLLGLYQVGGCTIDPAMLTQIMDSLQGLENVEFNVQVGGGPDSIEAGGPPSFVTGSRSGA
jgi:hypothetical protein